MEIDGKPTVSSWKDACVVAPAKEPGVHLILATKSNIKNRGLLPKNLILWKLGCPVTFAQVYKGSEPHICILGENFQYDEGVARNEREGFVYVFTDTYTCGEMGIYLLVFPLPTSGTSFDTRDNERTNAIRMHNLSAIESRRDMAPDGGWIATALFPVLGGEGEGRFQAVAPSSTMTRWTLSTKEYSPSLGMDKFVKDGYPSLYGKKISSCRHPDYKRMEEME